MIAKSFWTDRGGERSVKYSPGDTIPDDHPKRAWLIKSGIAETEQVQGKAAPVAKAKPRPKVEAEPEPKVEKRSSKKPLPTDSVDAQRAYLAEQGIETKGLSKPQMIKVIANLDN